MFDNGAEDDIDVADATAASGDGNALSRRNRRSEGELRQLFVYGGLRIIDSRTVELLSESEKLGVIHRPVSFVPCWGVFGDSSGAQTSRRRAEWICLCHVSAMYVTLKTHEARFTECESNMRLRLLGTNGYHPNEKRHTSCFMLPEQGIVLDAGTAMFRMADYLATDTLDIFLSHAHLDHVVGLTYLLGILYGRPMKRVTVHGMPEKLLEVEQHLFTEALFPVKPAFDLVPLADEVELSGGGRLTHFPLEHPGGSRGFRLDWPDRSMAYVTDTTAGPDVDYIELIRGVDLLVHECNFPDGHEELAVLTGHSCTTAVATLARDAEVGKLVMVHMDPSVTDDDPAGLDVAKAIFPNTERGRDNMDVSF